ncbi:MAG: helix-turn-helix transcriptional regulator [Colwellia sp.]|nr:helix-turn-helix transcriptional regulator [Colwellia sp.]
MNIKIKNIKQLGVIAKYIRKDQSLDQETTGLLSGNGLTFISQFENGKETVEIGRVFKVLEQLGIDVEVNLPPNIAENTLEKINTIIHQ